MKLVSLLAIAGVTYFAITRIGRMETRTRQMLPAGPGTSREPQDWDEVDEASAESFPASDPPARY